MNKAGIRVEAVSTTYRSGPLPTVEEFGGYEAVLPGAAERIMLRAEKMADLAAKQQEHRFGLENRIVDGNLKAQSEGLRIGGILSFIVLAGGIGLVAMGKPTEGLVALLVPLGILTGVFVYGKSQQPQRLADKKAAEMARESEEASTKVARRQ